MTSEPDAHSAGTPGLLCRVSAAVVRAVCEARSDDNWPRQCDAFGSSLLIHADRCLSSPPGYFILDGSNELSESDGSRFALRTSARIGTLLPQDRNGQLVRPVVDRGGELDDGHQLRYSDNRYGGNPHSDGIHRPGPIPDLVMLYCVRQAPSGGELILVRVTDIAARLGDRPEVIRCLSTPVHFDTREQSAPGAPTSVRRPVLDLTGETHRVNYLRAYIESAHGHNGVPALTALQIESFDLLDSVLESAEVQIKVRLEPGQAIVIGNRSLLHRRTEFDYEPDASRRRMLFRTWIAASLPGQQTAGRVSP